MSEEFRRVGLKEIVATYNKDQLKKHSVGKATQKKLRDKLRKKKIANVEINVRQLLSFVFFPSFKW